MRTFKQFIEEGIGHDAVMQFASMQHDNWRKSFDPENTGKERIKKNSDGTEGNINVPFAKLHPDWQKENIAAGKAALMAIRKHKDDIEGAAEHVHNEWMKRNPKGDWNADQHVPYDKLPESEKEKDREHVRTMSKLLGRTISEMTVPKGTTGKRKKWKSPMVPIRTASGKIEKHPPGKSGSSGGGGDEE